MMRKKKKKNKKSSKAQALVLPFLPEEIITDILTRLPVKTLVRFRSVSKSWLNLISNPNFINTHLLNSSKSNDFTHQRIIFWHQSIVDGPQWGSYHLKSCPFYNANLCNGHSLQLDHKSNDIVGSCNGLVCMVMGEKREDFLIWNPSTGESKKLSVLKKTLRYSIFGFGYDQLNDDYKVVHKEFDTNPGTKVVKLYSLRNNSWKKIGDFPNSGASSCKSEFVNGALHWQVWDSSCRNYTSFVIVFLDLGNETYGEIAQPNYGGGGGGKNFSSLAVVEGCISLCYNFQGIGADIWVMKEYGLRDSWVKLYTISYRQPPKILRGDGYLKCLSCDSLTGEILLKYDDMLLIYHTKYGTIEIIHDMFSRNRGATSTTYVESLVSP